MIKYLKLVFIIFILSACSSKQVQVSKSASILIITPSVKFYDIGFINKFDNYTQIQIYSVGNVVLDLKLYKNRVCKSTFKCITNKQFNKEFFHESYENNFFKKLLEKNKKNIIFRDKEHGILIKIRKK